MEMPDTVLQQLSAIPDRNGKWLVVPAVRRASGKPDHYIYVHVQPGKSVPRRIGICHRADLPSPDIHSNAGSWKISVYRHVKAGGSDRETDSGESEWFDR